MKKIWKQIMGVTATVGLLAWGVIGVTGLLGTTSFNFVEAILGFSPLLVNIVYIIAGVAGGYELAKLFK